MEYLINTGTRPITVLEDKGQMYAGFEKIELPEEFYTELTEVRHTLYGLEEKLHRFISEIS